MSKKVGRVSKNDVKIKKLLGEIQSLFDKWRPNPSSTAPLPDTIDDLQRQLASLSVPLDELISLQRSESKAKSSSDVNKTDNFKRLAEWMRREAPSSMIDTKFEFDIDVAEGCGLRATKELKKGEHFISIPRRIVMSNDTAVSASYGTILRSDQLALGMPSLMLAMHVLLERLNPDSFWRPYLDCLPTSFQLPLFFTMAELSQLQSSPVYYDALKLHKSTIRQYCYMDSLFRKAGHLNVPSFTYDDFRWAIAVVMSRQNRIPKRGGREGEHVLALIPGWDMCNGRAGEITTYFDSDRDESHSCTIEDVKAGDPIYICYGNRPNSKLLLFQGFILDPHPDDTYEFTIQLDDSHPLAKLQRMLLTRANLQSPQGFILPFDPDTAEYQALMYWIRVATLETKEEAASAMKAGGGTGAGGLDKDALNEAHHRRSWQLLYDRLHDLLGEYVTSEDDDYKQLSGVDGKTAASNIMLAIKLRWLEKRELREALHLIATNVGVTSRSAIKRAWLPSLSTPLSSSSSDTKSTSASSTSIPAATVTPSVSSRSSVSSAAKKKKKNKKKTNATSSTTADDENNDSCAATATTHLPSTGKETKQTVASKKAQ